ncbi:F-box protein SKIP23 isoform X1 [Medicago truncatula]|uniref:F-box protein n=2 Tax=Medicago truncatula TaxID=3880 RepID=A0A072UHS7_MEDTR|nr:F-box protein SKIP23 isoform X1 [Medicago truncatula]KEH25340.1 F-box protein [Medicago truncatula]
MISQRIYEEVDLIHFRSVCSTWRSSSVPKHHRNFRFQFPLLKFPFNPDFINRNKSFCYITKQNIFLIKPPQQEQTLNLRPSLIRICQNARGKSKLYHPLLQNGDKFLYNFVLDFNKLSILHLGSNFFMIDFDFTFNDKLYNPDYYMYPKKVVVVTCHGKKPLIVGTLTSPPQPLLVKCGDEKWKVIPDMSTKFGDICLFKGQPYAVDKIGKTVVVGPDSSVQLVAEPLVGGGDMKFLVESEEDLLLADVYDCLCTDLLDPDLKDPVRIDLFKLNEKEKKWVKLTSLGDRILFLGLGLVCSFSACASDLCVAKGNSVIFNNYIFESYRPFGFQCKQYVLDLDQGRHSLLSDCPEYSNLLWPPAEWIRPRYQGLDWGRNKKLGIYSMDDNIFFPIERFSLSFN